jgi:hypothetical protein
MPMELVRRITGHTTVEVVLKPQDMRKSFNGLFCGRHGASQSELRQGALYVFTNNRRYWGALIVLGISPPENCGQPKRWLGSRGDSKNDFKSQNEHEAA